MRRGADGETYLYTTDTLKSGEEVQIQYPKENGDLACCEATSSDGKPLPQTDVTDALHEADVHAYKLKARHAMPFVGIAVIGAAAVTPTSPGLEINDQRELIKTCFSQEGVHLFSSKDGGLKAHLYFSLGYDVTPTCDLPKS